ncbi:MAG: hypothetical protein DRJ52_06030 [Thermoprotei archaeon]|nr:MAG: hypothetical protein DRJ52_06030 [Thermoprotei archaeon]
MDGKLISTIGVEQNYEILCFTKDRDQAHGQAESLLNKYSPSAIVFIEKVGANIKGEYHTMKGLNVSKNHAKIDILALKAIERSIAVIGIGDGGNEVRMGVLEDVVRRKVPYGNECTCPCKGGIACHTPCSSLIVSTTSNWGTYILIAGLSIIAKKVSTTLT